MLDRGRAATRLVGLLLVVALSPGGFDSSLGQLEAQLNDFDSGPLSQCFEAT